MFKGWLRLPSVISLCMPLFALQNLNLDRHARRVRQSLRVPPLVPLFPPPSTGSSTPCVGAETQYPMLHIFFEILRIDLTVPRPSRSRGQPFCYSFALVHGLGSQSQMPHISQFFVSTSLSHGHRGRGGVQLPLSLFLAASLGGARPLARLRALSPGPLPASRFPPPYMY